MGSRELAGIAGPLYALPYGEFVAARTAAAKDVSSAGLTAAEQRALAAEVRALPKPSVAAWAVNMLAAHSPEILRELAALGTSMQAAQDALDAADLRRLAQQRRQLLAGAVKSGTGLGGPARTGHQRRRGDGSGTDPAGRHRRSRGRRRRAKRLSAPGALGGRGRRRRPRRRSGCPGEPCGVGARHWSRAWNGQRPRDRTGDRRRRDRTGGPDRTARRNCRRKADNGTAPPPGRRDRHG